MRRRILYIPRAFAETDQATLIQIMRDNSFAVLFSMCDGTPFATHLPLLVDVVDESVILTGHFAKANPHWQQSNEEVLVVFSGPHAYISPTWYEAENTVPTWNYVAVHACGPLTLIRDQERLMEILEHIHKYYITHSCFLGLLCLYLFLFSMLASDAKRLARKYSFFCALVMLCLIAGFVLLQKGPTKIFALIQVISACGRCDLIVVHGLPRIKHRGCNRLRY